jgi:hypothetical protein
MAQPAEQRQDPGAVETALDHRERRAARRFLLGLTAKDPFQLFEVLFEALA